MDSVIEETATVRTVAEWEGFASALLGAAGLEPDKARSVARNLVLTDALGRRTHGLAQCPAYLGELENGGMTRAGSPEVVRDTGTTIVWDGRYLPGLWLMEQALETAMAHLPKHGVVTFAMRRSHHIGCLATLAKAATDRGLYIMLASSGPHTKFVAPFGGRQGLFSPNPFAIGFPAGATSVLFDACASLTTVSMTREKAAKGEFFPHAWLLDEAGRPTCDPTVMERKENRGSLMLLGGEEAGHKGFGLALMVEALTQGLSGFGRFDAPTRWGASVFMQLIDPDAFAGRDAFVAQTAYFSEQCRASPPIDPDRPVRLPGDQAALNVARAYASGIPVQGSVVEQLRLWAERLNIPLAI